jgi:hypothetical protein
MDNKHSKVHWALNCRNNIKLANNYPKNKKIAKVWQHSFQNKNLKFLTFFSSWPKESEIKYSLYSTKKKRRICIHDLIICVWHFLALLPNGKLTSVTWWPSIWPSYPIAFIIQRLHIVRDLVMPLEHLQWCSLQKYFSHPSLVMYSFATPPIKLKLG